MKMRAFDKRENRFRYGNEFTVNGDGEVFCNDYAGQAETDRFVLNVGTGITDKNNIEAFEGDVVRFEYSVGDLAWETVAEGERAKQMDAVGKLFEGVVARDLIEPNNMAIECGTDGQLYPKTYFPLIYIASGNIIGNVIEGIKDEGQTKD